MLSFIPSFKKTKEYATIGVLLLCAVALFITSRFEGILYPALYQISSIVLITFAILIYATASKTYQYEIDENGDLIITEFSRKMQKVVVRIAVCKIASVSLWTKQEEKMQNIKTLYTYLGYFYKVPTVLLTFDEGVKVGIKMCYDEKFYQFLSENIKKDEILDVEEK